MILLGVKFVLKLTHFPTDCKSMPKSSWPCTTKFSLEKPFCVWNKFMKRR